VYHNGKTFFVFGNKDTVLPFMQARILAYDDQRGVGRPVNVGNVPANTDTHNVPSMSIDNNIIYVTQENTHDTPNMIYKSLASLDHASFSVYATRGTKVSYTHDTEMDGGGWFCWARGYQPNEAGYYSLWGMKSAANFESWGAQFQITSRPTGQDPFLRHYPFMPTGHYKENGWIHVTWLCRKDDGVLGGSVWNYRWYHAKTPSSGSGCGDVFVNTEGTFTHTRTVDGVLTDAIAIANFKTHEMDNDTTDGFNPICGVGPTGNFYQIIVNSNGVGYSLKYYDGSWHTKAISITDLAVQAGASAFNYLIPHTDDDIRVVVYRSIGGFIRPYMYRTTDQGTSWISLGDMCPEVNDRTLSVLLPNNIAYIPKHQNFMVPFTYTDPLDAARRAFLIKQGSFGKIQSVPGETITPATDMVYGATGLFDYVCSGAGLTKTGNNVTAAIDQFAIRNGAAANNPQWNGVDSVTCLAASFQRFTPALQSTLCDKGALTFIIVCKYISGVNSQLLSFANSANNNSHLSFLTVGVNVVGTHPATICLQIDKGTSDDSISIFGQDDIDDGEFHVLAFTIDDRARVDLFIDGKLQYAEVSSLATTLSEWQIIGKGPTGLTTAPNTCNIAARDRSTDVFSDLTFKRATLYNAVLPEGILRSKIKMLCSNHSITYQDQFQIPV
jgi:hypothetical protein